MGRSIAANGNIIKHQVVRISHDDFLTDTSTDNQTVRILGKDDEANHKILILNTYFWIKEAWAGGTVTHLLGRAGDTDRFITSANVAPGTAKDYTPGDGFVFKATYGTPHTTVGNNTGTSGAGLSAIPTTLGMVMTDDDNAATTGTALNVVPETNGVYAYLESANAGTADSSFTDLTSATTAFVNYNASPDGVAVYFDEDGATQDSRLLCVSPTGDDLLVPTTSGDYIRIAHDASAATNGVAVYFDDDGGTSYARTLFVSPTDGNGSYTTDDQNSTSIGAAVMNDLIALQEDINLIDAAILNRSYVGPYEQDIGSSGSEVIATIGTDTAWSALTGGETYAVVSYIDFHDL